VQHPYQGKRQDQAGIAPQDIQELLETEAPTLGEVMKTPSGLAPVVWELRGSVKRAFVVDSAHHHYRYRGHQHHRRTQVALGHSASAGGPFGSP
jgi:hypothetical protein